MQLKADTMFRRFYLAFAKYTSNSVILSQKHFGNNSFLVDLAGFC